MSLFKRPLHQRLINASHQLLMDGKSYRPNRRPGRGQQPKGGK